MAKIAVATVLHSVALNLRRSLRRIASIVTTANTVLMESNHLKRHRFLHAEAATAIACGCPIN
jgi:hypothetical protein